MIFTLLDAGGSGLVQDREDVTTHRFRSMLDDLCSESSPYSYKRVIASSGAMNGC